LCVSSRLVAFDAEVVHFRVIVTALTLIELFENINALHILDFIKDIGIYKQI